MAPFGIDVTLVQPGNVRTDFTANRRLATAAAGATDGQADGTSGGGTESAYDGVAGGAPDGGVTGAAARDPVYGAAVAKAVGLMERDEANGVPPGDIAVADDDGYLYLVDRVKDLIIVSGFNVFPAEVEEIISELPGVAEAAVVGVAHPHTGEAVKAYVVTEAGVHLDEETIIGHCRDHLARYKCPSKVLFVDELPHNVAGKLLRRALR